MSATPPPLIAQNFASLIGGLCHTVAARLQRHAPLLLVLWPYLQRTLRRFERLARRAASGRATPRSRPIAERTPASRPRPEPLRPRWHPPREHAWLVRLCQETAVYGSQLRYLLDGPEGRALLAAAPQAARMLAPLCRMLAIDPPAPPRPAAKPAVVTSAATTPRVRRKRATPAPIEVGRENTTPADLNFTTV